MISFRPTDEEQGLLTVARDFAQEQIRPYAREAEELKTISGKLLSQATELGFLVMEAPEALGGLEMNMMSQVQVLEALSFGDLGIVQGFPGLGDAASIFRFVQDLPNVRSCTEELADNACGPTVAFLEAIHPDWRWDTRMTLKKIEQGYLLHGESRPIRMAKDASYLLLALLDEEEVPVLLLLDKRSNSWTTKPAEIRLGLLAAGCACLQFEELQVDEGSVLARGDEAIAILQHTLPRIRTLQAAKEVGLARAALEYTVTYTALRKAFGQEIAKFQGVSFMVADMEIELQAAHHLVWLAASQIDSGTHETTAVSLQALSRAHRAVRFVTNHAVQLHGGYGFVQEYPVEKWMRDAQAQVMLYGREGEFLVDAGKYLIHPQDVILKPVHQNQGNEVKA